MGTVLDSHFLALTAVVTIGYQFLFFVVTALLKFDKVTDFAVSTSISLNGSILIAAALSEMRLGDDLTWANLLFLPQSFDRLFMHSKSFCMQGSTNFVILAILTLCVRGLWHLRQAVLTLLVVIWGLRLGLFLLMRILQWGEDRRFDEMRDSLGKLAVFWIFQAVWVWTVSLPVTIVNASGRNPGVRAQDVIGWIMWLVGFLVEATADQQKLQFKNSPANRGKWCNVGLWKFSRHPNYFGEIFLWWGIFVASTPVMDGAEWLVVVGPTFLTLLLLFISGIPLLEDSSDKRFGSMAEYRLYKK